jgi:hypothetical protein
MITKDLLSDLYDQSKSNYELAEYDWLKTHDVDYKKEMDVHAGEMLAYGKLLELLIHE